MEELPCEVSGNSLGCLKKGRSTAQVRGNGCIFHTVGIPASDLELNPRTWRNMMIVSDIHVLSAAFFMGLAAAAPMGPVNMLAIRRGLIGGWRHTLACGAGSVTGEITLFSLVLLGGHYLLSDLSNPTVRTVLAAIGVIVLLPLGIYFLVRAVKEPLRA